MNVTGAMYVRGYEQPLMEYSAYRLHKYLVTYVPPVVVLLGTIGNVLSIVILSRRSMRKQSTYFYLSMLSAADTVVLYVGLFRLWLGEILDDDIRDWNDWSCRLISFLGYTVSDFSGWLIIAVTFERFLAVCRPFEAPGYAGRQRALAVVCALFVLLAAVNCHFFWTVRVVYVKYGDTYTPKCHSAEPYIGLIDDVWPWVDAIVYSFLPFVIILVLNALIIRQIVRARRQRRRMRSAGGRKALAADGRRNAERDGVRITAMLMSISFVFLLTTLPMNTALIATKLLIKAHRDVRMLVDLRLLMTVTELLMYVNHSINFFLYCAAGHKFRAELVAMVLGRKSAVQYQHPTELSGAPSHGLQVQLIKPNDVATIPEMMQLQARVI